MSGTRRLIASKLELLADQPLVGPTDTQSIVSASNATGIGYGSTRYSVTPTVAQVIPANTSQILVLPAGPPVITPYLPAGSITAALTPSSANIAGNVLTLAEQAFNGYVQLNLVVATNKPAALTPVENFVVSLVVTDNLAFSNTQVNTIPITVPLGSNAQYTVRFGVFVPYAVNRTAVNFVVSVNNGQTANTLTIQTTSIISCIQAQ